MSMNHEGESVSQKEPDKQRLPYHTPRLVSLGSVQSLVRGTLFTGSDAGGPGPDCAFA
jgi:hypothetical protein